MTRALELTQRQVRALCEGARKAGFAPVVRFGNTLVWLLPADRAIPEVEKQDVDETKEFRL